MTERVIVFGARTTQEFAMILLAGDELPWPLITGVVVITLAALGWMAKRWITQAHLSDRLTVAHQFDQIGVLSPEQKETLADESRILIPPKLNQLKTETDALAIEAMKRAIEQSESGGTSTAQIEASDLETLRELIGALLNQLTTVRHQERWLYGRLIALDNRDARYPLMKAMNDAVMLKTLKFMEFLGVRIIETEAKEISSFSKSIDPDKLRAAFDDLAEICHVPEDSRNDIREALNYARTIVPPPATPRAG